MVPSPLQKHYLNQFHLEYNIVTVVSSARESLTLVD